MNNNIMNNYMPIDKITYMKWTITRKAQTAEIDLRGN